MQGIDDWEVAVAIDLATPAEKSEQVTHIASLFPLNRVYIANRNRGNLDNLVCGLSYEFSRGAEEVIFIEDDFLLRSDLLQYLDTVNREDFLISFSGAQARSVVHYRPRGNLISKRDFPELCEFVMTREYIGEKRIGTENQIFSMKTKGHDGVFSTFVVKYEKNVSFPGDYYVGNFGIIGMNSPEIKADQETIDIESRMFSGSKDSWMDNVVKLMAAQAHEKFWPPNFVYK